MTTYRKKLIEVALPLKAINEASAREKSIRHGHPSTLHLWWARRPLAACRAVLFASLVDDPDSDPAYRRPDGSVDLERAGKKRAELFNLIEELVQWENSNNPRVINQARAEIARCVASRKIEFGELAKDTIIFGEKKGKKHAKGPVSGDGITAWEVLLMKARPEVVNAFLAEHAPPVLDPFCGGGSIPLEAQRLGLRAYASDLNPVPVLITKALIEIPPKFAGRPPVNPEWQKKTPHEKAATVWQGAQGLADDVRYYGQWMRDEAEKRIGHLYPKVKITAAMAQDRPDLKPYVGQELTVIAWLWARTVASPNPACGGAHVPLVRSFWLSTKKGNEAWVEPILNRKANTFRFEVQVGKPSDRSPVDAGTKVGRGCKFRCLLSDQPISEEHIKDSGMRQQLGSRLLAAVLQADRNRVFLSPRFADEQRIAAIERPPELKGVDAPIAEDKRALWCLLYGQTSFDRLFTNRQLAALATLTDLVEEAKQKCMADARSSGVQAECAATYGQAVALYLGEAASKTTAFHCTQAGWRVKECKSGRAFGRQAMPMVWDYAEVNPFADAGGGWTELFDSAAKTIRDLPGIASGVVEQRDATQTLIASRATISTDPPYYDNVGYSDLSDFYYVWLRRCLKPIFPSLFSTLVCPKREELIASPYRFGGDTTKACEFFESGLRKTFEQMRGAQLGDMPLTVYYAFKQAESDDDSDDSVGTAESSIASTGWETMLER
jgi:putative DNA methylase